MDELAKTTPQEEPLAPITIGGRVYLPRLTIQSKYEMQRKELLINLRKGLPYKIVNGFIYINELDLHRYFSGVIGERSVKNARLDK